MTSYHISKKRSLAKHITFGYGWAVVETARSLIARRPSPRSTFTRTRSTRPIRPKTTLTTKPPRTSTEPYVIAEQKSRLALRFPTRKSYGEVRKRNKTKLDDLPDDTTKFTDLAVALNQLQQTLIPFRNATRKIKSRAL